MSVANRATFSLLKTMILFHTSYTRFQALEIIRENAFREERNSEPEDIANKVADEVFYFYQRCSNHVIAGQLQDIANTDDQITVTSDS